MSKSETEKKWEQEKNLAAFDALELDFYTVSEWTPLPDGKGKPEQVHFGLHLKGKPDLFLFPALEKQARHQRADRDPGKAPRWRVAR